MNGVTMFVVPSFLSSQTPAGRGGWPPFPSLVLPEVSSCLKGVFSLHSRLMHAQDSGLDRSEVPVHFLVSLARKLFLNWLCMNELDSFGCNMDRLSTSFFGLVLTANVWS